MQSSVNNKYMQHLNNRKKRLSKLKDFVNKSDPLTKLFCVYLARSNYPKSDAFEILPKTMKSSFDIERSNSKHLKGANFLDSILG
ncbi:hypothetical protein OLEAN_C25070 [Oleispira antarctica RB-8]|uniref:Uncharacterized protein n=1 Tax=Oleispira antarctica RB-8 TaxID=698738 RepID=R4YT39_OLEAN|nr:hypothetical protein OLEAN_C25070 [Oleispira antarctica RB-8]